MLPILFWFWIFLISIASFSMIPASCLQVVASWFVDLSIHSLRKFSKHSNNSLFLPLSFCSESTLFRYLQHHRSLRGCSPSWLFAIESINSSNNPEFYSRSRWLITVKQYSKTNEFRKNVAESQWSNYRSDFGKRLYWMECALTMNMQSSKANSTCPKIIASNSKWRKNTRRILFVGPLYWTWYPYVHVHLFSAWIHDLKL